MIHSKKQTKINKPNKQKLIRITNRTLLEMLLVFLSNDYRYKKLTTEILDNSLSHDNSIPLLFDEQQHPRLYELIDMIQKD